ncbi:cellulose biosynthesis cyclic di-GMP-binding regulatory protein BcsB [Moritella marina ATCC 15381]|uniref:Cyclic di-GMP-binding protein n=1 Tax=Moritella marina ATCC 15381 TaxID=1202962 RepID=A0A5J6WK64_MORMI|nr:cellulose biosynthesis cyclic di-GMP-binding regulatory protein BcsB [Moritella marina]QFI36792.1 cellulose biosynthesis cyclic di-GMP-binding regulatory protein BcsB [Moritella marina ATCC 15381]
MKNFILILLGFILSFTVFAETKTTKSTTVKVPLTYIMPAERTAKLQGQWDKLTLPLIILENQNVEKMRLYLTLSHSEHVTNSTVWLHLNNSPLANIKLPPKKGTQQITVNLTPELLTQTNNQLTIAVHHQLPSSIDDARQNKEISTEIIAKQSFYELSYRKNNTQPTLANFMHLIQSGQANAKAINLDSLFTTNSDTSLSIASLLVQGWTLRSGSDKYKFNYQSSYNKLKHIKNNQLKSKTQLIYGTKAQLKNHTGLPNKLINAITGPFIATSPYQSNNNVLVISGINESDVKVAAQYFATANNLLPKQAHFLVTNLPTKISNKVVNEHQYHLNSLTSQQEFGPEPLVVPLIMPANFIVNQGEIAQLNLQLTHPKVTPGEAEMVLRVNGERINSMPLRASYWRTTQHYRLTFPMATLKAGMNHINIAVTGLNNTANLTQQLEYSPYILSLSPTSTLKLGAWVRYQLGNSHQVNANELLIITNDDGSNAQLSLNYPTTSGFTEIWQLISAITHQARQSMPALLLTTNSKQTRPVNLIFNLTNQPTITPTTNTQVERNIVDRLRTYLLNMMQQPHHETNQDNNANARVLYKSPQTIDRGTPKIFASTVREHDTGELKVYFQADGNTQMTNKIADFLASESINKNAVNSALIMPEPSSFRDELQLLRAGLISHPYFMPLLILCLILPLGLLFQQRLGARK